MRLLLALAVAVALLGSPSPAAAQRLQDVLVGTAAPRGTARLDLKALSGKKPEPLFLVIDTPYEIWSGMGSYVHVAVYKPDFSPARGARVYLGTRLVATADEGTVVFKNVPRPDAGDDGTESTVRAVLEEQGKVHVGAVGFGAYARTPSFETAQLFVYTDRGAYNPGQPILVRLVAWQLKGDYRPLAGESVEVTLVSSMGRVMGGQKVVTDEFGVGALRIPLPEQMPEGDYRLAVAYKTSREDTRLKVERFAPPALELVHDLKRYFTPKETGLAFTVQVKSLAGGPLKSGGLQARLELRGKVLESLETTLDGRERYAFSFSPKAVETLRAQAGEGARFDVVLDATDSTGRSDSVRRDVTFLRNPWRAVLEADKDEYSAGEVALVNVKLVDVEGVPARGKKVRVQVEPAQTKLEAKTDANGVALFRVPTSGDQVTVDAYVDEVEERIGEISLAVLPGKPMVSKVEVPVVRERAQVPIDVYLAPDLVPTEGFVHGDVVDSSGALVNAFLLPISTEKGRTIARGKFVAPTWGTMLLTLFVGARKKDAKASDRYGVGLLTEGQQISVQPDKALTVTLGGLPKEARPGSTVAIKVRVAAPGGRRVDAELGAAVVDSGVLAKLDPLETTPGDRFYDPELKVLSTTGSKILTWPVVSRNWGENQRDIALPPFGLQGPDLPGQATPADAELQMLGSAVGDAVGYGGLGMKGTGSGGGGMGYAIGVGAAGGGQPRIVIRDRFPETAFWEPRILAKGGEATLTVRLPDSITRQAVTVMASDKAGGIGFLRQDLQIRQDLFARSDFPATLVAGDEIEVRASVQNLGARDLVARLALSSKALTVVGEAAKTVAVPAQGSVGVAFRVRAGAPGKATYELSAEIPGFKDVERREIVVRPAGSLATTEHRATLARERPYSLELERKADEPVEASLSLAFPGAAGLVAAFLDAKPASAPYVAWEAPGSSATTASHLRRALDRQGLLTKERRAALDDAMAADFVLLSALTDASGAVTWLRTGTKSAYLTAKALQGLTALREADFPVPDASRQAMVTALLSACGDGACPVDDLAFWEGAQAGRQQAFTTEIFRSVCEAGASAVPGHLRAALDRMAGRMRTVAETSDDPLAVANAALGVRACATLAGQAADPRWEKGAAERLLKLRRQGYWEPSWFHAYGGTLEATAASMELLSAMPVEYAAQLRESATYLLGTRDGFGNWRNPSGTAAVARALASLPRMADEVPSTVRVEVNGKAVLSVAIDPKDPFASALPLARLELTPMLVSGKNTVTVSYDGALEPALLLEERRVAPAAPTKADLTVRRTIDRPSIAEGETAMVQLKLTSEHALGPIAVEEPIPSNAAVDRDALEALRKAGTISDFQVSGRRLVLYLDQLDGPATLTYPLVGGRAGRSELGPTRIRLMRELERTVLAGTPTVLEVK